MHTHTGSDQYRPGDFLVITHKKRESSALPRLTLNYPCFSLLPCFACTKHTAFPGYIQHHYNPEHSHPEAKGAFSFLHRGERSPCAQARRIAALCTAGCSAHNGLRTCRWSTLGFYIFLRAHLAPGEAAWHCVMRPTRQHKSDREKT